MKVHIKASIVISTYNRHELLAQLLELLHAQELESDIPFEVLIVDDGSTDATKDVVAKYIKEKKYTYDLRYFNTGLTNIFGAPIARNIGIKNARGKYVLFLDDDCMPHKQWVAAHLRMLDEGNPVCIGYVSNQHGILKHELPITIREESMQRLA